MNEIHDIATNGRLPPKVHLSHAKLRPKQAFGQGGFASERTGASDRTRRMLGFTVRRRRCTPIPGPSPIEGEGSHCSTPTHACAQAFVRSRMRPM
jgi:hypothetical protein